MKVKTVNRTIAVSRNCRCKYGNPEAFDILQVNISFNNVVRRYEVESKYLSKVKDSIHFYPSIMNDNLQIKWDGGVAPYIREIRE